MTISVIIPTYNCATYLPDAIQSILDQSRTDVEIVVVDDGSTDNTPDAVASFNGDIVYHRQSNAGVSVARNTGIDLSRGDYIAFLDADDRWYPDKLAVQLEILERSPGIAGVFSDFSLADQDGKIQKDRYIKEEYSVFRTFGLDWDSIFPASIPCDSAAAYGGDIFPSLFRGNFIKTSSLLLRRSAALSVGGFTPNRTTQEDYEYFLKLASQYPLAYADRPLLFKRRRPGQLTSPERLEEILRVSLDVVEEFSDTAAQRLGREIVDRRMSNKYRDLASHYFKKGQKKKSFANLRQAMRYRRLDPHNFILLLAIATPRSAVDLGIKILKSVRSTR